MSDKTVAKPQPKKAGLGRGLGSLLGGGDDGAFSKAHTDTASTLEVIGKSMPSQEIPAIKAGIIEKPTAPVVAATISAPALAPKPAPTPVVAAAPAPSVPAPVQTAPVAAAPKIPDELRIWKIGIEKLKPNPKQPRQVFDKEPLDELANSIREKGILSPLLARKMPDGNFEIIAGERRWRAAQLADLKEVPVLLKQTGEKETLELALIENIQRQDLNPIEEAEAYDHIMTTYKLTQQEMADRVGKERATVANVLRLLNLCPEVRLMVSLSEISFGHAKILLGVQDANEQIKLADRIKKENMSVRVLEQIVNRMKGGAPANEKTKGEPESKAEMHIRHLQEEIQKIVGSKVSIDYNDGKGKMAIHFYSGDELNELAERIREAWLN